MEALKASGELNPKYRTNEDKINLFLSAISVAKLACSDKLLQIYFVGLRILELAMDVPVCGSSIHPKLIVKEASAAAVPLINKIEELNFKTRETS